MLTEGGPGRTLIVPDFKKIIEIKNACKILKMQSIVAFVDFVSTLLTQYSNSQCFSLYISKGDDKEKLLKNQELL